MREDEKERFHDSDPYVAFDESWGPMEPSKRIQPVPLPKPLIPKPKTILEKWGDEISAHPLYTALVLLVLFILAAIALQQFSRSTHI